MKRILALAALFLAAVLLFAQQHNAGHLPLEVLTIFPRETSPGLYAQVGPSELQNAAEQGWELVSVTPYVYRNEERGTGNPKAVVTQTYPAYFFRRVRVN